MPSICFYFQVHQPYRLKPYSVFDIGNNTHYFDEDKNKTILHKVAEKCYLPANNLLLELLQKYPDFKISFSFSGVFLEQCEKYYPQVLESFQKLVATNQVEILSETYYHSLAFVYKPAEFVRQVLLHQQKIQELFKITPKILRNTELIYRNDLGVLAEELGYKGILAEGTEKILGWRSANFVYQPVNTQHIRLLLKNYQLSDDIAFRFSERSWKKYPLTADTFAEWISMINGNGEIINLFMDYETFGEHQWEATGIFEFLRYLPEHILKHPNNNFKTPSEIIETYKPVAQIDAPYFISWADTERDLSAWLGNNLQQSAISQLYELEHRIKATENQHLIDDWCKLQTSDHFYYMCTKWFNDGDVHKYFNPYDSPYDGFIYFMNVLKDLQYRCTELETHPITKTLSYSDSHAV